VKATSPAETVIHVDLDAFFYAMEELRDPSLQGKPVVVGGAPGGRGVVTTASYEARKYGIRSAMPASTARRLCPQAIFLPTDYRYYAEGSRQFHEILRSLTPLVEPAGMDEAYMDVRGCEAVLRPASGEHLGELAAQTVRRLIREEIGIPASAGVSTNKLVSKVASDAAKPDGLLLVRAGEEAAFLAPMDLRALPGIGRQTEQALRKLGLSTLGDLQTYPGDLLQERFGSYGLDLARHARGESSSPVTEGRGQAKSVSREMTFGEDEGDRGRLRSVLRRQSERVGADLQKHGLSARTVSIKYRYPDFETHTAAQTLERPTTLDDVIFKAADALLMAALRKDARPLRLLGVAASGLGLDEGRQLAFDAEAEERSVRLNRTLDEVRGRFGSSSLETGLTRFRSGKPRSDFDRE
jgi:DNA polymerase-4